MTADRAARFVVGVATAALVVLYPACVFLALTHGSPRMAATVVGLGALFLGLTRVARARAAAAPIASAIVPFAPVALLVAGSAVWDDARFVLAVPVLTNLALLASFGATLRPGATPLVERFARAAEPAPLDAAHVRYCRKVTVVWCVFFASNAAVSLVFALHADAAAWALYTGVVSYGLVGTVFAVEYVVRKFIFRHERRDAWQRTLAKIAPPSRLAARGEESVA